jgi:hypothetical protein
VPHEVVNPAGDPDRGATRTRKDREPSALQQSSDDEAAVVEANAGARSGPGSSVTREAIAEAAYCRAERRGFEPGHELEDWFAAEHELMEREGAGVIG